MVTHITGVQNGKVMVVHDSTLRTVIVQNQRTEAFRCFDGPGMMSEMYELFITEFTDDCDYDTALLFFKLNLEDI
jgi:hypothetical protein